MVEFKDRILKLIDSEQLTPASFASIVGMQRSNVSHLLSGRNQPSFDIINKILNAFRSLNSDWLILGTGPMYRNVNHDKNTSYQSDLFDISITEEKIPQPEEVKNKVVKTYSTDKESINIENKTKKINRIIVYFSDNTFEEFNK